MSMHIGIDARMYGLENAGIGRYVINLVSQLGKLDKKNTYTLFVRKKYKRLKLPKNFRTISADFRHYSLREQLEFPKLIRGRGIDLMHFPHFNVPLTYNDAFVVTIHDMLWHKTKGLSVTSLSPIKYLLKYAGYKAVVKHALIKSKQIIVPSFFVKKDVSNFYPQPHKISVTYEGVDSSLTKAKAVKFSQLKRKLKIEKPFIVYTGSAYPHKNIKTLIDAVNLINHQSDEKIMLVLISSRNIFLDKLKNYVKESGGESYIKFAGFLKDEEVKSLYQKAVCLVHPSKSEGFGLTGLEAMSLKLPVIAADATCLPEIYQEGAILADPDSAYEFADRIVEIKKSKRKRNAQIKKGNRRVKDFSWKKMVKETIEVYKKAHKQLGL